MRRLLAVALLLGCQEPAPIPSGLQISAERAPEQAVEEARARDERRLQALVTERRRLEALSARIDRARAKLEDIAPRLEALRSAILESSARPRVVSAVAAVAAIEEEHDAVGLFRVEAFESGWTIVVKSKAVGEVLRYNDALALQLELDDIRHASYPQAGTDAYRLGFGLPGPDTRVVRTPVQAPLPFVEDEPDAASAAAGIEALNDRGVSLDILEASRNDYESARDELTELETTHMTGNASARSQMALIRCAERQGLDAVRMQTPRRVRHHGLAVTRHDMRGVGVIAQINEAVKCLADSGVLIGVLSINRVRRQGRYRIRVELNVAKR